MRLHSIYLHHRAPCFPSDPAASDFFTYLYSVKYLRMKKLLLTGLFIILSQFVQAQCFVNIGSSGNNICGQCNAWILMSFSGGTPPYTVNFNGQNLGSNFGVSLQITDLCPGTYPYIVTDANADTCNGVASITIGSWGTALFNTLTITNPSCPSCNDGIISATASGGTPPYFYQWNTGINTSTIGNLGAGIYILTTTDSMGCTDRDTVYLSYSGSFLHTVSGKVFFDVDNDGLFGGPDIPLRQQQIQKTPAGQITFTDNLGNYIFGDSSGTYTYSYLPVNGYSISNGIPSHTLTLTNTDINGQDFAVQPDSMFHSLYVSTFCTLPRCSSNAIYMTTVSNTGTYIDSGSVQFTFDPLMLFSGSTSGGTVSGHTITFTFDSLLPFETRTFYSSYLLPGPGTVVNTSTLGACYDTSGVILSTDSSDYDHSILCAFDPNDKQVMPEGDGSAHRVDMDTELRYLIRFQNTGNDTAFNIVVIDTIDAGLDPNSVYVIATSHPCWIQKVNGHIMQLTFDNILLPDSNINEPESHGFILFKAKGSLLNTDPTIVYNTAYIYFDQNAPVSTNTTFTTFSNSSTGLIALSGKSKGIITFSPHPLHGSTMIRFDGVSQHTYILEISDLSGRRTGPDKKFYGNAYLLQRENMPAGMYFVRITDEVTKEVFYSRMLVN